MKLRRFWEKESRHTGIKFHAEKYSCVGRIKRLRVKHMPQSPPATSHENERNNRNNRDLERFLLMKHSCCMPSGQLHGHATLRGFLCLQTVGLTWHLSTTAFAPKQHIGSLIPWHVFLAHAWQCPSGFAKPDLSKTHFLDES